ncbi:DUF3810 domain-containing protein [Chitinophaga sp. Cy-1792]|uniref:DUF3810 domain-containing protein n=1 Tax=Chitinophaga sp. Cy-1792 TaxID=2608339 RepID=UPI00142347D2|nr:DUF3810 domain-containing protein [Chitinophaga sp. Cy-1792]NIG57633.1 DUF3810 domain-containing protein [Chitinophaga sp. Cy-1792]
MELNTKIRIKVVRIVLTLTAILLLKGLMVWSYRFENFYFYGWYKWTSVAFRQVMGIVPFSVGDVIYAAWIITGIIYLLKLCYKLFTLAWADTLLLLIKGVHNLLKLYLAFLVLWGLNYDRQPLPDDTGLAPQRYNTQQLWQLADTLLLKVNQEKFNLGDTLNITMSDTSGIPLFTRAKLAYDNASQRWPAFRYRAGCVKASLYGRWINYMGITGYLNPWSLEAQVNMTTPPVLLPYTTCHEIAHQLGYAPEEDANFVGYLAASNAADSHFRYAANLEMLLYSVRQLAFRDSVLAKDIWSRAVPGVKEDYKSIVGFYRRYEGKVDDYSAMLYDQYLKANKQEQGIQSYADVTRWLIAYYRIQ